MRRAGTHISSKDSSHLAWGGHGFVEQWVWFNLLVFQMKLEIMIFFFNGGNFSSNQLQKKVLIGWKLQWLFASHA